MPVLFRTRRVATQWTLLCALVLSGCETWGELPLIPPEYPTQDAASITDRHGGTHYRTLVNGTTWYQTFGTTLLVLDVRDGSEIDSLEPLPFGTAGAFVDMAIDGDQLWLVADGDAVCEFDLTDPLHPELLRTRTADSLGIRPRSISVVDGQLWVAGDGGAIQFDSNDTPKLVNMGRVGSVVMTDSGLAAPVGRRVHAVEDGAFLGAATALVPLPDEAGIPGGMLFMLQGQETASVGVMGPDVRQLDDFAMRGRVHAVRYAHGRIWAVTDKEIATASLNRAGKLGDVEWIDVKGARDVADAGTNHIVVAGSFGRALFRFKDDEAGAGDTFLAVTREPGRLIVAVDDGRRVLSGSKEGAWLYTIGDSVELVDRALDRNVPASDFAAASWGDARIVQDGRSVVVHLGETDHPWTAPNGATVRTLIAMGRRLWIGHDEGLALLTINGTELASERLFFKLQPPDLIDNAALFRIPGGVTHIMPVRVGDEVVWVSPSGGIGTAAARRVQLKGWDD